MSGDPFQDTEDQWVAQGGGYEGPRFAPPVPQGPSLEEQMQGIRQKYADMDQGGVERVRNIFGGEMTAPTRTRQKKWGDAASFLVDRIALPLAGAFGGPAAAEGIVSFMGDADNIRKQKQEQERLAQDQKWKAINGYMNWRENLSKERNNEIDQLLARHKLEEAQRRAAALNDSNVLLADARRRNVDIKNQRDQGLLEFEQRNAEAIGKGKLADSKAKEFKATQAQYAAEKAMADRIGAVNKAFYSDDMEAQKLSNLRTKGNVDQSRLKATEQLARSRSTAAERNIAQKNRIETAEQVALDRDEASIFSRIPEDKRQQAMQERSAVLSKFDRTAQQNPEDLKAWALAHNTTPKAMRAQKARAALVKYLQQQGSGKTQLVSNEKKKKERPQLWGKG